MIDRLTITGMDDGVPPEYLAMASLKFPFVEWGVLVSQKRQGTPRYPSYPWIAKLASEARTVKRLAGRGAGRSPPWGAKMRLSLHVCGSWLDDLQGLYQAFGGKAPWLELNGWRSEVKYADWFREFERIQFNFHGQKRKMDLESSPWPMGTWSRDRPDVPGAPMINYFEAQLIYQMDGVNDHLLAEAMDKHLDAVPLHDKSGGQGVVPSSWPRAEHRRKTDGYEAGERRLGGSLVYHGYAGGLNPDNIAAEARAILEANEGLDWRGWLDLESGVRDANDNVDLKKVEAVLRAFDGLSHSLFAEAPAGDSEGPPLP
jgi:hypothetical protein